MSKVPFRLFRAGTMPTSRIESFSDNVFAFTVTLLILEIQVPMVHGGDVSGALAQSLVALIPKFLAYVFSFVLVCLWWVAHHHLFHIIKRSDRGLLWCNSLFLLWLTMIPFPTAFVGDYPGEKVPIMLYGAISTLAGFSFCIMRYYVFYHAKLVDERTDPQLMRAAMRRSVINPLLHIVAVLLALVNPYITLALYVMLMVLFFIPSGLERQDNSEE